MNKNTNYIKSIVSNLNAIDESEPKEVCLETILSSTMQALYCSNSRRQLDRLAENKKGSLSKTKHDLLMTAINASVDQQPCEFNGGIYTSYQLAIPVVFVSKIKPFNPVFDLSFLENLKSQVEKVVSNNIDIPLDDVYVNSVLLDQSDIDTCISRQFLMPAVNIVDGYISTNSEHLFDSVQMLDDKYHVIQKYIWLKVVDKKHPFKDFDFCKALKGKRLSSADMLSLKCDLEDVFKTYFLECDEKIQVTCGPLDTISHSVKNTESVTREANLIRYLDEVGLNEDLDAVTVLINTDPDTKRVTVKFFEDNEVVFLFDYGYECLSSEFMNSGYCHKNEVTDAIVLRKRLENLGFKRFLSLDEAMNGNLSEMTNESLLTVH